MKLSLLLQSIKVIRIEGEREKNIKGICLDSRQTKEDYLFIAVKGTQTDGQQFIPNAVAAHAAAIVCQNIPEERESNVTYVQTDDSERAVGLIATTFYGNPTNKLKLVGVTGTNGKTTIATLLYHMFRKFGFKCGLVSTVCNYIDDTPVPTEHTTPDPVTLNQLLGRMTDAGCTYAFMEVSSHAAAQQRIAGLHFAGAIFTNLTRDHMDYHKTFENYRNAKKAFFDNLPNTAFALTNIDDKNGIFITQNTKASVKTYSQHALSDFNVRVIEENPEGMTLNIQGREVSTPLIGRFNASNLLAIYAAAILLGQQPEDTLLILSTLKPVSGRFETIHTPNGVTAIIDYAHTPDALANVLATIHEILKPHAKVITVCGAGGNRDKGKRPLMAREAVNGSHLVILTSDNPRYENPESIIGDMVDGLDEGQMKKVLTVTDRKQAIRTALTIARKDDIILIAGKGHETYQEINGVKHHYDDHETVIQALQH